MKCQFIKMAVLSLLLAAACSEDVHLHDSAESIQDKDVLFQTTPYSGMLDRMYDGAMTVGELRKHGDTGVGTFNALDGELVGVDGEYWQVRSDGSVRRASDDMMTPFAVATMFEPDLTVHIDEPTDFSGITALIDSLRPTDNIFYAIRLRGSFLSLRTKSVPKQTEPYPHLAEILLDQPFFDLRDVSGVMAGFWLPLFIEGINVPGYHLHFLTDIRDAGGHVVDCVINRGVLELDYTPSFHMELKRTPRFDAADLTRNMQEELARTGQYDYLEQAE